MDENEGKIVLTTRQLQEVLKQLSAGDKCPRCKKILRVKVSFLFFKGIYCPKCGLSRVTIGF